MILIIDRIEEGIAVCETEDGSFLPLSLAALPLGCGEGTVLIEEDGVYRIDREEEEARRQEAIRLQQELFGE